RVTGQREQVDEIVNHLAVAAGNGSVVGTTDADKQVGLIGKGVEVAATGSGIKQTGRGLGDLFRLVEPAWLAVGAVEFDQAMDKLSVVFEERGDGTDLSAAFGAEQGT